MATTRREGNRVGPSGRRSLACSSPPFSRRQTSARAASASAGSSTASLEVASAHPRSCLLPGDDRELTAAHLAIPKALAQRATRAMNPRTDRPDRDVQSCCHFLVRQLRPCEKQECVPVASIESNESIDEACSHERFGFRVPVRPSHVGLTLKGCVSTEPTFRHGDGAGSRCSRYRTAMVERLVRDPCGRRFARPARTSRPRCRSRRRARLGLKRTGRSDRSDLRIASRSHLHSESAGTSPCISRRRLEGSQGSDRAQRACDLSSRDIPAHSCTRFSCCSRTLAHPILLLLDAPSDVRSRAARSRGRNQRRARQARPFSSEPRCGRVTRRPERGCCER